MLPETETRDHIGGLGTTGTPYQSSQDLNDITRNPTVGTIGTVSTQITLLSNTTTDLVQDRLAMGVGLGMELVNIHSVKAIDDFDSSLLKEILLDEKTKEHLRVLIHEVEVVLDSMHENYTVNQHQNLGAQGLGIQPTNQPNISTPNSPNSITSSSVNDISKNIGNTAYESTSTIAGLKPFGFASTDEQCLIEEVQKPLFMSEPNLAGCPKSRLDNREGVSILKGISLEQKDLG